MKFSIILKSQDETWSEYESHIEKIKQSGLPYALEVLGEVIDSDQDFYVFTETQEALEEAGDLIQMAFIDLANLSNKEYFEADEWALIEPLLLVESFSSEEVNEFEHVTLQLKNGSTRTFVGIPWE